MKFIFDVDGTLTPSRQKMNPDFRAWFNTFCLVNDVYLVTGSDKDKTVEQISESTYNLCKRVYNCSGNDVWEKDVRVKSRTFEAPTDLYSLMDGWLQASLFPIRTGNHIEERAGAINFSIVGRNATPIERAQYVNYDKKNRERESIAHVINAQFDNVTATVGGETGIDIYNTGCDKGQLMEDFRDDEIIFFGDRMDKNGNDYPLSNANTKGKNYHVYDWRHTWELLKGMT